MQYGGNVYAQAMSQFAVCRQPWNEYIRMLTKEDATPYNAPLFDKPMYRGRKRGMEGWLFRQQSQLHFHMYPDEAVFTNLTRWRQGETVGDLSMQQFRNAQPFNMEREDPDGMNTPSPETYLKLNYKNPLVFSQFLTRTGSMYPRDILPVHPEAFVKIRSAKMIAQSLGLYPRFGNPFWHRTQKFRPKPNRDAYDPLSRRTKVAMEHYAFNWLQTDRVRRYFDQMENNARLQATASSGAAGASSFSPRIPKHQPYESADIPFSGKNPTVPGLMSVSGMKKKMFNLYSGSSKKRMGFTNPLLGIVKQ